MNLWILMYQTGRVGEKNARSVTWDWAILLLDFSIQETPSLVSSAHLLCRNKAHVFIDVEESWSECRFPERRPPSLPRTLPPLWA